MHKGKSPHCAQSLCCVPSAPVFITLLFLQWGRSWLKTALRVLRIWMLCICDVNWMKRCGKNKRSTQAMAAVVLFGFVTTQIEINVHYVGLNVSCVLWGLRSNRLLLTAANQKRMFWRMMSRIVQLEKRIEVSPYFDTHKIILSRSFQQSFAVLSTSVCEMLANILTANIKPALWAFFHAGSNSYLNEWV